MEATSDEGVGSLRLRMVATLLVVVVLPVLFVYAISPVVTFLGGVFGAYSGPLVPRLDPALVVGGVAVALVGQYALGPRLALHLEDADPVPEVEYPELYAVTRQVAAQYDLPAPAVAVVDSRVPNAFVVGRGPDSSTLAVTEGLLETLDREELEAVVAHELAHVSNRDSALMSVAYLLPTVTYWVAMGAFWVLVFVGSVIGDDDDNRMARNRSRDSDDGGAVLLFIVLVTCLFAALVAGVFWAASYLTYRLFAQKRELAADDAAAATTGDPATLASALQKIDEGATAAPDEDLRAIDGGAESLFVVPVEAAHLTDEEPALLNADLFPRTHPDTDERIDRLERRV